jgi:phage terminase large subunit
MLAAAERIRQWRERPAQMVRELFGVEPDAWQEGVLEKFPHNQRQAMKACKGPGKTTVLAWLAWNFLLTRPHPKIAATSVTEANLSDGLWTEMSKWQGKSPLLKAKFTWTKTRIFANDHPETWWMSARTWPKGGDKDKQADTLAGLHADYLLFILDEAGSIPDAVMAAAEAGLASGIECHLVMAGNPTRLDGPLYRACTSERTLWDVTEITSDPDDPKRTPRVSVEWAQAQIAKYGRDNPWVLVNVFGKFPPSSLNALLGPDEVRAAMHRQIGPASYDHAARILGVDVARFGDDQTVIARRQGLLALPMIGLRNQDAMQVAGRTAMEHDEWDADAIFVDSTGGYGSGVVDALRSVGRKPIGVEFSSSPLNAGYLNKRAEILWLTAEWVKNGGKLPDDAELLEELTAVTYWFKGDQIQVEAKDQIKVRLGRSPDKFDALACTFAFPVTPRSIKRAEPRYSRRRAVRGGWAA